MLGTGEKKGRIHARLAEHIAMLLIKRAYTSSHHYCPSFEPKTLQKERQQKNRSKQWARMLLITNTRISASPDSMQTQILIATSHTEGD